MIAIYYYIRGRFENHLFISLLLNDNIIILFNSSDTNDVD